MEWTKDTAKEIKKDFGITVPKGFVSMFRGVCEIYDSFSVSSEMLLSWKGRTKLLRIGSSYINDEAKGVTAARIKKLIAIELSRFIRDVKLKRRFVSEAYVDLSVMMTYNEGD